MTSRPASSASFSKTALIPASDPAARVIFLVGIVALAKPCLQSLYHLIGRSAERLQVYFGILRRLVGRIEAGEVPDRTRERAPVEPLRIAAGAFLERRV